MNTSGQPRTPARRRAAREPSLRRPRPGRADRGQRIDDATGALVVVLVAGAAIPAASVAPTMWLIWAVLAGVMLAGHALAWALVDPSRGPGLRPIWPILLSGLALPVAALGQLAIGATGATAPFAGHAWPMGSLAPEASRAGVLRLLGYGALFVVAFQVSSRPARVRAMAWGLVGAVALNASWSLVSLRFLHDLGLWSEKTAYLGMATGTFTNRNAFASYLGMGLVVGLALMLEPRGPAPLRRSRARWQLTEAALQTAARALLLAVIAAALVMTQSRMGVAASLVAAAVTVSTMAVRRGMPIRRLLRTGLVFGLAAMGIGLALFGQGLLERGLDLSGDVRSRGALYRQIFAMIGERPWLGVGLDAFPVAFELVHQPPVSSAVSWEKAHSSYLTLWSEMGVLAGSLAMFAVAGAGWQLAGLVRRQRQACAMATGALGVIVLGALHATVDFSLEIPANTMLFLTVVALGLGPLRRSRDVAPARTKRAVSTGELSFR